MPDLTLSLIGHAGVVIHRGDQSVVIDPGVFSEAAELGLARAVLLTHGHADHTDVPALSAAMASNEQLEVWGPASALALLTGAGIPRNRVHELAAGAEATIASFGVLALGGSHAVVHPSLPPSSNLAYLIEGQVFHPGDSYTAPEGGVSVNVLLLPLSGPWVAFRDTVDHVRRVDPRITIPIHDVRLSDLGKRIADEEVVEVAVPREYRRLSVREVFTP